MRYRIFIFSFLAISLTGCISSEDVNNEHQVRMQRCEQYVGQVKERCLRGELVTIEEYKEDYREFERQTKSKETEEDKPQNQ